MSFLRSPGSEGSVEAPPTLCTWPSNRLGAGRLCLGVWIQPLRGQLSQDMGPDGLFFHLLLLRASPHRIPNMCPCWDCHPPAEYPSQLCCAGWGIMSPCPREAGVPNELISVGKALGDLGLKGVQYTQIRVIVITHNYGVFAGEIIPKRTVAGPAQSPAKICSSTAVESIFLPCLSPSLPARVFSPSSGPAACSSTANAFFVSSLTKRGTWRSWRRRGPSSSHSLSGSEKDPGAKPDLPLLFNGSTRGALGLLGCGRTECGRAWEGTLGRGFHAREVCIVHTGCDVCAAACTRGVCVLPASPPSDCVLSVTRSLARQLVPQWLKLNLLPQPEHVAPMLTDPGNAQNQQSK